MSTAQDLQTAAINNTQPYGLDWAVMEMFIDNSEYRSYSAADDLTHRTFLLLVAEALDYREPMPLIDVYRIAGGNGYDTYAVCATKAHHGIGSSK